MTLGVVLAGGQSSRFGSDKAFAELGGHTLIARSVELLSGWCEQVVVAGRVSAPVSTIADWPRAGMGPLGGIAAALHLARDQGYASALTIGVDAVGLPGNLPELLAPAPAYVASQPVIGLWPASAVEAIETILTGAGRHSMLAFAEAIGARPVQLAAEPANINTPADLAAAERKHDL
jgi:molybdenum cofactor guanylyltransferase